MGGQVTKDPIAEGVWCKEKMEVDIPPFNFIKGVPFLRGLVQTLAVQRTKKLLKAKGLKFEEKRNKNGTITLTVDTTQRQ
jgi:hypothetical protein